MRPPRILVGLLAIVIVSACGGAGTPAPKAPASAAQPSAPPAASEPAGAGSGAQVGALGGPVAAGGDMCGLLGPGDFAAAGVPGAGAPTRNSSDPSDVACVYAGRSSATGGIELDAFVSASVADAEAGYSTAAASGGVLVVGDTVARTLGVDQAALSTAAQSGGGPFASILVRQGRFVFGIGFPTGGGAETQLYALARLVLDRGAALAK